MTSSNPDGGHLEDALAALLDRQDAGTLCALDEVKGRFPQYASELGDLWKDLRRVPDLAECQNNDSKNAARLGHLNLDELPQWPRFDIKAVAGSGGQGVVYRAVQQGTQRCVALKVIRHGAFSTPAERRRFELEIELASRLNHPHIVSIYECGTHQGQLYCAMEYVDGVPLDSHARLHLHDLQSTVDLFCLVCDAVIHAHRRGVLHRDLKPSNILVDAGGLPHIVDFGLAKRLDAREGREELTSSGEFAGTWHYASPEQARCDSAAVDMRTDVYSLGVILYELLTDCSPYPVDYHSRESVVHHILHTDPMAPSTIRPELDRALCTILLTALQKDPARRYQTVEALKEDLVRWKTGEPISAQRDGSWFLLKRLMHRHRWKVAAGAFALLALVTLTTVISVLYAAARTAQATADSRTALVRASRNFAMDRLGELSRVSNALTATRTDPSTAQRALARLQLPHIPACGIFLSAALGKVSWYANPSHAWIPLDTFDPTPRAERLRNHVTDRLLHEGRLEMPVARRNPTDFVLADEALFLLEIENLVDHLLDLSPSTESDWAELAVTRFDSAYTLGRDLGDGPQWFHKAYSVELLDRILDRWFRLVEEVPPGSDQSRLLRWAAHLAPPAAYQPALILEYEKIVQMLEASTYATSDGRAALVEGRVIMDAVYRPKNGLISGQDMPPYAPDPSLEMVIRALNAVFNAFERWDQLSAPDLRRANEVMRANLAEEPAGFLIRALAPSFKDAMLYRARVGAKVGAARMAASLSSSDSIGQSPGERLAELDPYSGGLIGAKFQNGFLLLYSRNDDGVDNGLHFGPWNQPGTDVLIARIPWPTPLPVLEVSAVPSFDHKDTQP